MGLGTPVCVKKGELRRHNFHRYFHVVFISDLSSQVLSVCSVSFLRIRDVRFGRIYIHPLSTSSYKCTSDDEASSATSGSGPRASHFSPHHSVKADLQMMVLNPALLLPITDEINTIRDSSRRATEVLMRLSEEFEDYKVRD